MFLNFLFVLVVYFDVFIGIFLVFFEFLDYNVCGLKLFMECGIIELLIIFIVFCFIFENWVIFVDVFVFGGFMGVQNKFLIFMVGCLLLFFVFVFFFVKFFLCYMGDLDGIFFCGDVGVGMVFKIINNYLLVIMLLVVFEVLNIGVKVGLDFWLLI